MEPKSRYLVSEPRYDTTTEGEQLGREEDTTISKHITDGKIQIENEDNLHVRLNVLVEKVWETL